MTKQGDATLESRLAVFAISEMVKRQIAELRRRYIKLDVVITSGASYLVDENQYPLWE